MHIPGNTNTGEPYITAQAAPMGPQTQLMLGLMVDGQRIKWHRTPNSPAMLKELVDIRDAVLAGTSVPSITFENPSFYGDALLSGADGVPLRPVIERAPRRDVVPDGYATYLFAYWNDAGTFIKRGQSSKGSLAGRVNVMRTYGFDSALLSVQWFDTAAEALAGEAAWHDILINEGFTQIATEAYQA